MRNIIYYRDLVGAMPSDSSPRLLKTTQTSLQILRLIKRDEANTLTALAQSIDKPKSSVFSQLKTLENEGLIVEYDGEYQLGMELLHFGSSVWRSHPHSRVVIDEMKDLSKRIDEDVHFLSIENGRLYTIYAENDFDIGSRYYMHNTAAGKAALAEFPDHRIEAVIDRWGLPSETEQTITDPERLHTELAEIKERGYAIVDSEFDKGTKAVGAAVHNPDGRVFGALGVGGPSFQLRDDRLYDSLPQMVIQWRDQLEETLWRALSS